MAKRDRASTTMSRLSLKPGKKGAKKAGSKADTKAEAKADAKAAGAETTGSAPAGVEERGAFAVARCDRCGWQGSARRSRDRARKDLRQHLEDKPKHADHVSLEDVPR